MTPGAVRYEVETCPRATWVLVDIVDDDIHEGRRVRAGLFVRLDPGEPKVAWWSFTGAGGTTRIAVTMGKA